MVLGGGLQGAGRGERTIVLASSSPYRRALLERLGLAFEVDRPLVDEDSPAWESADQTARRLAAAKAEVVAGRWPGAIVIGSDQCAARAGDGARLGKPGDAASARRQLLACSARAVVFHTGLCVIDVAAGRRWLAVEPFTVVLRALSEAEVARYVDLERPYDCAGAFKAEGLGVTLFERTDGDDATSLVGLPLIRLCHFLREAGVTLP